MSGGYRKTKNRTVDRVVRFPDSAGDRAVEINGGNTDVVAGVGKNIGGSRQRK